MKKKRKIIFLAPKGEGGTYYYYKDISSYLKENYNDRFEVYFYNSLKDYVRLHFIKCDVIFSIIPFLFKPIFCKKFIFNLHGNYKIERKSKGLGVKLLYLAELNLWFCDKIMLTSYYLADKLSFRKKYEDKIVIISNFIKNVKFRNKQLESNKYNFLTITNFGFYEKAKGILNLGKVIKILGEQLPDKEILFTIVGSKDNEIFNKIKLKFDEINFSKNVKIEWKGWLDKNDLGKEFLNHNTFLYWTYLDNFPGVVLEAINYNLKVLVNNYESFKYFLDEKFICKNEDEMGRKFLKNKTFNNNEILDEYSLKNVGGDFVNLIF